jgi:hypothetical protein
MMAVSCWLPAGFVVSKNAHADLNAQSTGFSALTQTTLLSLQSAAFARTPWMVVASTLPNLKSLDEEEFDGTNKIVIGLLQTRQIHGPVLVIIAPVREHWQSEITVRQ